MSEQLRDWLGCLHPTAPQGVWIGLPVQLPVNGVPGGAPGYGSVALVPPPHRRAELIALGSGRPRTGSLGI